MFVLIATKNEGKIESARRALSHYFNDFEIEGVGVPSEVSDQPVNEEVTEGVKNRLKNLKKYAHENNIHADLYLAIESGINNFYGTYIIQSLALIEDELEFSSFGTSSGFPVPDQYIEEIISTNLSKVMNKALNDNNPNRHNGKGGISILTDDVINRIDIGEQAFVMALVKKLNKNWN